MMKIRLWSGMILAAAAFSSDATELVVHVGHVEGEQGFVCVAVYRTESGYLAPDDAKAFRRARVPAHSPDVVIRFPEVPAGKYAIKVFHDENGDGTLNRNFLGAPTEPYGISNAARARFSLPPFADALIAVENAVTETYIDLARH